tara:strand:- start:781 stop:1812 length:1032 start_codon:yes stop_codon:yes gene_type:complete
MNLISFFTSPLPGLGDVSWSTLLNNKVFKALTPPQFKCATFDSVKEVKWNNLSIDTIEERNRARAGGVDEKQIQGIISTLRDGYKPTEIPPIVMIMPDGTKELWDGYHRYCAAERLTIPSFPCLIYRLNAEWENRLDDAYDIVSLGANNHLTAKRHTRADFITRGVNYSHRNGNKSLSELKAWINSISHSFNDREIESIAKAIFHQTTVAVNVKPYEHPKIARKKVAEIEGQEATASRNPVVMCCKEDEYVERALLSIILNHTDPENPLETTDVIAYTKNCENAEQVVRQRENAIRMLQEKEKRILQYAAKRLTNLDTPSYEILGFLPQLVDVEDMEELVAVD